MMTELLTYFSRHPAKKTHFDGLYLRSRSLGKYPELQMTIEAGNVDQLVNRELTNQSAIDVLLHFCVITEQ